MQSDETERLVEEEAPDGTVVIYDSENPDAWIQSTGAVDVVHEV